MTDRSKGLGREKQLGSDIQAERTGTKQGKGESAINLLAAELPADYRASDRKNKIEPSTLASTLEVYSSVQSRFNSPSPFNFACLSLLREEEMPYFTHKTQVAVR